MSDAIVNVTDDSFEAEVLNAGLPVIVDFWAEWCGPCKMIAPVFEGLAKEFDGKVKFAKLNVDQNLKTPPKYGVRGIPMLIIYKNGEVEASRVGALTQAQMRDFVNEHVG